MAYTCYPRAWEVESGRSRVRSQSGLCSKPLSQKNSLFYTFYTAIQCVCTVHITDFVGLHETLSMTCKNRQQPLWVLCVYCSESLEATAVFIPVNPTSVSLLPPLPCQEQPEGQQLVVMVILPCQVFWIWADLVNRPLNTTMKVFAKMFNGGSRTLVVDNTLPGWLPDLSKKRESEWSTSIQLPLLPDGRCDATHGCAHCRDFLSWWTEYLGP